MPLLKNQITPVNVEQKANLRSSFDSYNGYRGDMEQARQKSNEKYATDLSTEKAMLTSQGTQQGSPAWNNTLAQVERNKDDRLHEIDNEFDNYKKGAEYKLLYSDYTERVLKSNENAQSYNQKLIAMDMQGSALTPSFDEYVDSQYGSADQQASVKQTMSMRRQNEMRAQQ